MALFDLEDTPLGPLVFASETHDGAPEFRHQEGDWERMAAAKAFFDLAELVAKPPTDQLPEEWTMGTIRTKPDIVVPTSTTSWATATVSSAAGLIIGVARATPALTDAQTSEMVKALLMAGATKTESEFSGGWTHSSTQPLDAVYGAGELNVENSYDILTAGEYNASSSALAGKTGWDFGTASASSTNYFFFDLTSGETNVSFTAVLTWNSQVTATDTQPGPGVSYNFTSIVPNLDLRLYNASGFTIGSLLESSVSSVDNTELVYRTGMSPGRYAVAISSDTSGIDYGLAWVSMVPEPGTISLLLIGALGIGFQSLRRGRRS